MGSDAVHGGTYVLLFVGSERLVIDDTVFQLIQHSVGRVEGLARSVHVFLAFVLLPLQSYDLCTELLNFSELFRSACLLPACSLPVASSERRRWLWRGRRRCIGRILACASVRARL